MKQINEMTENEKNLLRVVVGYTKVSGMELNNIKYFINNYIDTSMSVCSHCKSQIKFAHKKLMRWYEKNKDEIFGIPVEQETPTEVRTCKMCDTDISDLPRTNKYCAIHKQKKK